MNGTPAAKTMRPSNGAVVNINGIWKYRTELRAAKTKINIYAVAAVFKTITKILILVWVIDGAIRHGFEYSACAITSRERRYLLIVINCHVGRDGLQLMIHSNKIAPSDWATIHKMDFNLSSIWRVGLATTANHIG